MNSMGLDGSGNAFTTPAQSFSFTNTGGNSESASNYTLIPVGNQLFYNLTNTTSFSSAAYHLWPSSWNWNSGPMGNANQTYIFSEPQR